MLLRRLLLLLLLLLLLCKYKSACSPPVGIAAASFSRSLHAAIEAVCKRTCQ
jgi:hypothetical protein